MSTDRIDLVRQVQKAHMFASASSKEARGGESWRCQCGVGFHGAGALERGHRHEATEILAALDEAATS